MSEVAFPWEKLKPIVDHNCTQDQAHPNRGGWGGEQMHWWAWLAFKTGYEPILIAFHMPSLRMLMALTVNLYFVWFVILKM